MCDSPDRARYRTKKASPCDGNQRVRNEIGNAAAAEFFAGGPAEYSGFK